MHSVESARAYSVNGFKLARPPDVGLYHAHKDINQIRKPESTGTQEILSRPPSEQKADKFSISLDELDRHDIQVSEKFLYQRVQVCITQKDLELGRQVQAFIKTWGQHSNAFLASHLIRMFSCCGSLSEAYLVFCKLPAHNVFTWSAMIAAYASNGQNDEACNLFKDMLQSSIKPDEVTFVVILKACASIPSLIQGAGLFMDAAKLVELSKHVQAWRKPGKAYIEIGQNLHEFVVGETTGPSSQACYRKLKALRLHGSCEGCVPQLDLFCC